MEYVVRPFDRKAPILGKDFAQRMKSSNAGGKAQFGRPVWVRRIDQKKACMKIAPRRRPNAAIAAAAFGLRRGDNPESSGIALFCARQSFVVGRSELVMLDQPECFVLGRASETKQGKTTIC